MSQTLWAPSLRAMVLNSILRQSRLGLSPDVWSSEALVRPTPCPNSLPNDEPITTVLETLHDLRTNMHHHLTLPLLRHFDEQFTPARNRY